MNYDTTPWGVQMTWANTKDYSGSVYIIKEGEQTPFGYYKSRDITILVLQGVVNLVLENRTKMLLEKDTYHINPQIMYQLVAVKGDATILEVGTRITSDFVEVMK